MPSRDLATLEKEISLYPAGDSVWLSSRDIKNSAGNLCLHLGGNLPHYISAVLGKSGYIRNRENEFSAMGISTEKLIAEIRQTKAAVTNALEKLNDGELGKTFPEEVFNAPMTTQYFLIHLTAHLCYHLGQINYHRRLL